MSRFTRCDTCRAEVESWSWATFGDDLPPDTAQGWRTLGEWFPDEHNELPAVRMRWLSFCSWRCLADYVTAQALIENPVTREKP